MSRYPQHLVERHFVESNISSNKTNKKQIEVKQLYFEYVGAKASKVASFFQYPLNSAGKSLANSLFHNFAAPSCISEAVSLILAIDCCTAILGMLVP